jgi:hypothetical protein
MRVILHIGPHKTGTTAIQTFMAANAELLSCRGIRYPIPTDGSHNHHEVAHAFRQPSLRGPMMTRLRRALDESASTGCSTFVLSSEMFVEHEIPIHDIVEATAGHEVSVIAYLRSPDGLWASAYSQLVIEPEARRTARIDEDPPPYDCTYSTVLCKWMHHFRPGTMVLAPFDRTQWPGGSLLRDFLGMAGAQDGIFEECDASVIDRNPSLPAVLTEIIRRANASALMTPQRHTALVARARRLAARLPRERRRPERLRDGAARARAFELLEPWLETYRPYYRPGFDDSFLRIAPKPGGVNA